MKQSLLAQSSAVLVATAASWARGVRTASLVLRSQGTQVARRWQGSNAQWWPWQEAGITDLPAPR